MSVSKSDRVHVSDYLDFSIFRNDFDGWFYAYRSLGEPNATLKLGRIVACDKNYNRLLRRCRIDFYGC